MGSARSVKDVATMNQDIYKITTTGRRLTRVVALPNEEVSSDFFALTLYFDDLYMHVEADPDDDDIIYKIGVAGDPNSNLSRFTEEGDEVVDVSNLTPWKNVISHNILWFWELESQNGAKDAVQFWWTDVERRSDILMQFMGIASAVQVTVLEPVK